MPRHHVRASQPPDLNDVPMSEALRALAARAEPRLHGKGRVLIHEGSVGNTLYIILSGRLRAYSVSDDGARCVTYGEYLPGEFLGEMSLDGGERSASVEAVEPSWCVQIVRPTLEQHIAEYPAFAFELLSKVIRRARAATLGLRAVALNDVYGRVAWLLNDRAVTTADGSRIVGPVTHRAMAELLACGRPMVSRVMKELAVGGYVRRLDAANYQILRALPARF